MLTKTRIAVFSLMISFTLIFSIINVRPAEASRESSVPANAPTVFLPVGSTYTKTPTFSWRIVTGATYYRISVFRRSDNLKILYELNLTAGTYCKGNYCSFTPTTFINPMVLGTEYKWKIAAGNAEGLGSYSALTYFIPKGGINSTFVSDANGWQPKVGTWALDSGEYYRGTYYASGNWISSRYSLVFDNFSLETSIDKPGTEDKWAYGIIIRGDTSTYKANKMWNTGYLFVIADTGYYAIFKENADGTENALVRWTMTSLVDPTIKNKLKVSANGTMMQFFINGVLVNTIYDSSYTSGRDGLVAYYTDTPIYFDYVKLTMPLPPFAVTAETAGRPAACKSDSRGCLLLH